MAAFHRDKINSIQERNKKICFGYIHETQQQLPSNNSYYNIPDLIVFLCILYYSNPECFTVYGNDITITDEWSAKNHAKTDSYNTAYGNVQIDGNKHILYEWTFKIYFQSIKFTMVIGIDSSNKYFKNSKYTVSINKYPHYSNCNGTISSNKQCDNVEEFFRRLLYEQNRWKIGDIIKMEINTKNKTIKYKHNDKDLGIAYKNIDFTNNKIYNLAIFLYAEKAAVQLLNFSCIKL